METIVFLAIMLMVVFAGLQAASSIIELLWEFAPKIIFIALCLMYVAHDINLIERMKDAEHNRLTQIESTSGEHSEEWMHDEVLLEVKSRSKGK